jgi:phosphopantothenoylcysteine synthetase/decarboxylase
MTIITTMTVTMIIWTADVDKDENGYDDEYKNDAAGPHDSDDDDDYDDGDDDEDEE